MRSIRSKFLHVVVCLLALYAVPAAAQDLIISEYIEGSSNNKAIEIYNGTGAPVSLSGYNIQMFFNGSATAGLTINLNAVTLNAGDTYVLAHGSADPAILAKANQTNSAGWFNGDDAVVLRKGTTVVDSIGQVGFDPGAEWGTGLVSTADNTLRRKSTVTAGDTNISNVFDPALEWDGFATNTFDGLGTGVVPPPLTLEIYGIQGDGPTSPHAGRRVETFNNIVTALTPNGFFIQTPVARADASDQTSNGIYVFTGSAPTVKVGDQVDVTATVTEFFGMTELINPTVSIDSSNNALPPAFLFTQIGPGVFVPSHDQPWPANELERFEGMLVRVENGVVTGPTDRFGDTPIVADNTRAVRGPGMEYPGQGDYTTLWDGNPEIFDLKADGAGLPAVPLAAGTVIHVAEGPLAFSFSDYQLWPTTLEFTQPQILRPVRARNAGEFTVASQNLLRFFDAVNDPEVDDDDETASPELLARRLQKASLHIRTVLNSPDVLVVEEVENLPLLQALAGRIAADDPTVVYTAHLLEGHDIGGIDTGFLVRDTVAVNSVTQVGYNTTLSLDGSMLNDRPALVLDGDYIANGAPFPITVIGVHNRSLSGIEGTGAGANRVRQKRLEQALELANYVQSIQSADPNRRIIVTGDFNAFPYSDGFVDSMGIITGNLDPNGAIQPGHVDVVDPNLINQGSTLPASEKYSFIFNGSAQTLDHTLTTQNLSDFVRGLQFARGNADAPVAFRNDPTTPLGTSDHDGEVLFVMTDADADGLPDDADNCATNPNPNQSDFDGDNIGDACDADDDNDGVLDDVDACQLSEPLGMFVVAGSCTTDVPDQILINGCSITASIASFGEAASNHGKFVSSVAHFLNDLRQGGVIDNKQRSEIQRCAAWANVP